MEVSRNKLGGTAKKRIAFLCLFVALCPVLLWAGPIYGTIFINGHALSRASISITCVGAPAVPGNTLDDGSYRVAVPREGRCTFTVTSPSFQGQASADVVSLPNAAEYNFSVVPKGGGGYELRRR
jgi:hypothetical protein